TSGDGGFAKPLLINPSAKQSHMKNAISGFMGFNLAELAPKQSAQIDGTFYVGPKEITNLSALGKNQDLIMNFGWVTIISKPLSILLSMINSAVEKIAPDWSWGWSIIILTLIVRLCLWPLTSVQIRSQLKMGKLQQPLAEIKKKYAGNQQKISQETMKLYSEYGINPLAGCLPMFIQLPIFLGLYYMLQTSAGVRFAHFMWIRDLSLPDYIPGFESVMGVSIHPLILINILLTVVQMNIVPMPSADKTQKVMMSVLMPAFMLFICYNFPSGVILYWTMQSFIGLIQTIIVNSKRASYVLEKPAAAKPGFMQRMAMAAEQAQKMQALKGTKYDSSYRKNPGGRSTPAKRK
ncbi:MAG: YidC/Oxa1 family insertase periplasmic-domain containing protein, partial [Opitutales bacterium]|nr:YidC/Oxa1 family insertase periplasmic-domain containing protein [Opitutales bacterium]